MKKLVKNEDAFTGLEAAIVLIAFIVVAAVFSYVMLGAGFFATGEAQRTVHTGMSQATSNLEVAGPAIVLAKASGSDGVVEEVAFFLQLAAGGAPVDIKKVTYTVSTTKKMTTYKYDDLKTSMKWYENGAEQKGGEGTDAMLDKFESVRVTVKGTGFPNIGPNDRFTVEVKPDIGATLPINRIAPPNLEDGKHYEVY